MQYFEKTLIFAFRKSLRALFTILVIHGEITDAIAIWDLFAIYFCDNLPYQLQNLPNIPEHLTNLHHNYNLYLFSKLLKEPGKTLDQCELSLLPHTWRAHNFLL